MTQQTYFPWGDGNGDGPNPYPIVSEDIWDLAQEKGTRCPTCHQHVKYYKRTLSIAHVRAFLASYRAGAQATWVHIPTLLQRDAGAYIAFCKLKDFKLTIEATKQDIVTMPGWKRGDSCRHVGYWMISKLGMQFLTGDLKPPKYVILYDNRILGYHRGRKDECRGIRDIDNGFDFDDL